MLLVLILALATDQTAYMITQFMRDPAHPTQRNTRCGASALWKQSTVTREHADS